jgi:2-oxoisovalerate dehydrogenase E2 component (dihydrolipoyl transacylase)
MAVVGAPLVILEIDGTGAEPGPEAVTPLPTAAPIAPLKPLPSGQILASPALRRRAKELGIKLALVEGFGPAGRISQLDLDAYLSGGGVSAPIGLVQRQGGSDIKVIGLRRKIAEKMSDAQRRIAHFSYVEEFDLTALEDLRRHLNENYAGAREKLTLLPFLMRPMVQRGQVVIRKMMNLSSSFDHRVVDGFDAASFIQAMRLLLENPKAEQSFFCDGA